MNQKTKKVTTIGLYIAIAVLLEFLEEMIPLFKMPNGGNICIAIIPIIVCSYEYGPLIGMGCGFCWWLLTFILGMNNYIVSFPQMLLDYLLPSIVVGLASAFPRIYKISNVFTGITGVMILRLLILTISGALFWFPKGSSAGSMAAWIYSITYNASYTIPTFIVVIIITPILINKLNRSHNRFKYVK